MHCKEKSLGSEISSTLITPNNQLYEVFVVNCNINLENMESGLIKTSFSLTDTAKMFLSQIFDW